LARPLWGLSEKDAAAVCDETIAVLENDSFAPLFGPGSKAEVPITGLINGRVLSAQVDRLVVTGTDVMVIDYKTNRPPPRDAASVSPAYLFQMATYRAALREIYPNLNVRCLLLWTDGPFITELSDDQLDDA
jgi:ATP-dependent helicase/nuclease subunit A